MQIIAMARWVPPVLSFVSAILGAVIGAFAMLRAKKQELAQQRDESERARAAAETADERASLAELALEKYRHSAAIELLDRPEDLQVLDKADHALEVARKGMLGGPQRSDIGPNDNSGSGRGPPSRVP